MLFHDIKQFCVAIVASNLQLSKLGALSKSSSSIASTSSSIDSCLTQRNSTLDQLYDTMVHFREQQQLQQQQIIDSSLHSSQSTTTEVQNQFTHCQEYVLFALVPVLFDARSLMTTLGTTSQRRSALLLAQLHSLQTIVVLLGASDAIGADTFVELLWTTTTTLSTMCNDFLGSGNSPPPTAAEAAIKRAALHCIEQLFSLAALARRSVLLIVNSLEFRRRSGFLILKLNVVSFVYFKKQTYLYY